MFSERMYRKRRAGRGLNVEANVLQKCELEKELEQL